MTIALNGESSIVWRDETAGKTPEPISYAIEDLAHDLHAVFGDDDGGALGVLGAADSAGETDSTAGDVSPVAAIVVNYDRTLAAEQYQVTIDAAANEVIVAGADDLGCIYGLYAISREWLGFDDFWFWNDRRPAHRRSLELPADARLDSKPAAVRYRGWFVNDEVLLMAWNIRNDNELTWRMVFATLLRTGGNLVIPGSGQNEAPHWDLAHRMGLYVNQHHATPLGARLFCEAYPGVKPRWPEDRDKYEALWREAIEQRCGSANDVRTHDPKVVWTVGLRGSSDGAFWYDDPRHQTDEDRGRVLSEAIRLEYDLIRATDPNAPISTYLYSEALELYRKGLLTFPDDVIKIWADNGYGRMMVRRNGNWDPREPAMPRRDDPSANPGANGIYYHVSFYDLQAANHITPMPESPDDVTRELNEVLANGGDSLWIVNCSNVKSHTFALDLIARLWRDGTLSGRENAGRASGEATDDTSTDTRAQVDAFLLDYCRRYYGEASAPAVARLFRAYWDAAVAFGPHWDEKCGEQFYVFLPRMIITHYLSGNAGEEDDLKWLARGSFSEQIAVVKRIASDALPRYAQLVRDCERAALDAEDRGDEHAARLIRDSIELAAAVYRECAHGATLVCTALEEAFAGDFKHAFYHAGLARERFEAGDAAMRSREHGVWQGYWANDCEVDVKFSAQVCAALMSYLRNRGDGPHYYRWQHEFNYAEQWRDVIVVLNVANHETDDQIFQAMKRAWGAN